jgi:molybdenum cofactor cytidylyltransferase
MLAACRLTSGQPVELSALTPWFKKTFRLMRAVGALVLAAGLSRRFGADKRRALLPTGESVIEVTLTHLTRAFVAVHLVLREEDDELHQLIRARFPKTTLSHCPTAHLGMGHSLAHGAQFAKSWNGIAICLADMPYTRVETLEALIDHFQRLKDDRAILIPTFHGDRGHPVLFGCDYLQDMAQLTGDQGARRIIETHPECIHTFVSEDAGILRDIDRPADMDSTR